MRRLAVLAFALAAACTMSPTPDTTGARSHQIVGGYAPADETEPGCKEAEAPAIDTIYKRDPQRGLVENKSAQIQVVAGLNFLFDIKMTGTNRYTVRIYRDLQGQMMVSEFSKTTG
jgi:hypothetical protein